jgi:putative phosphoribosyl transferase
LALVSWNSGGKFSTGDHEARGISVYFLDRQDAGRRLAEALRGYQAQHPIILALPRGGVVVGFEIARALDARLDVFVVRKIGAPQQPELGIGAVAEDGTLVADSHLIAVLGVSDNLLEKMAAQRLLEVEERVRKYRGDRPMISVAGETVILVDDGLATGNTAHAAIRALQEKRPGKLILAVPVGAPPTVSMLGEEVDELVCLEIPPELTAIGYWYFDFRQVSDEEVLELLERARQPGEAAPREEAKP